ncbi:protein translocase subunit secG [Arachidicoccus rhizosphaerae]|jgi:preprotein translocase subunit SecG|uniref:Protein-export membrane protein SecG n=1 Tax=Arachidicoccus rhizosphaerae TaxID=551991 RepID=A0A1H4CXT4_9BACT|nr:preprotein translocase subunit SecG [Arachidicoccus rhizosphaerae]SEA65191.1 protein translocase subunit secG [Arachidicoccus rhizosphaerae]
MALLFFILVIIVSIVLAFFVLIQNPEGGGLSGSIGGFSNQIMGVKKTNNVLEKGTWLFALIIGLMCLFSVVLFTGSHSGGGALDQLNTNVKTQTAQPAQAPAQSATPAEAPASQPAEAPAK